jgi:hypothetical protein
MGPAMGRTTVERRQMAAATRRNDRRLAHAASLTGLAATALENAAGDLSGAHGEERRPLTGLRQIVVEEAARISRLAADIESHMGAPRPAQCGARSVSHYTSVMD